MTDETTFRTVLLLLAISGFSISTYYRRRADRAGGRIPRGRDGGPMAVLLAVGGMMLMGSLVAYLISPSWMAWARLDLPAWARWLGVAVAVLALPSFVWFFRHLGLNITPTASVRAEHRLVTTGPYRYIRHPLYTFGSIWWIGLSLVMASWWTALAIVVAFAILAWRSRAEEAVLLERFGDDYRRYRERTGRYLPRWRTLRAV